jgi:gliding motility-associated-like protein
MMLLGLGLSIFSTNESYATHLRGGEISIKRISTTSLTYEFTLTIYCDLIGGARAWADEKEVFFCFGDGLNVIGRAPRVNGNGNGEEILPGVGKGIYKTVYTFAAPSDYRISVAIPNRNANVRNLPQPSDQIPFYIETILKVNPGLGQNSTPLLLNAAVDLTAVVGQKFIHNPNAVDIEGDSLAYKLIACRRGEKETCVNRGSAIIGFRQPNEVATVASSFTIDSRTGDLVWDVPQEQGLYNTAFIVEEWRNGVLISVTVRDMQIEVKDADNAAPKIKVPEDICVEAGTLIDQTITATDTPSKSGRLDNMTIFSSGQVYRLPDGTTFIPADFATFANTPNTASPVSGRFRWQTNCNHVRAEPYDILFKVQDLPRTASIPSLVDSKIWKIRIIAPRIKNLTLTPNAGSRQVTLRWDSYACQNAGAEIIIYRKEGCNNVPIPACTIGIPAGYTEVGRVPVNATTFTDRNLKRNTDYSYRTVVLFTNGTNSTTSVTSDQACANLPFQGSLITNVTVDKTDNTTGEITVRWTRPINLDRTQFRAPYQYRLFRATGQTGATGFTQVSPNIDTDLTVGRLDTLFKDTGLNTTDNAYRYRLVFYYTNNNALTALDTTEIASSVRAAATGDVRSVTVTWQATVPWNNQNQTHRVYRETRQGSGIFNRIADVPVTNTGSFTFTDRGGDTFAGDGTIRAIMSPDSSYCYKVETVGTYGDPKIKPDLLYNFSQVICAIPKTDLVICPPTVLINTLDCNTYNKDESNCNLTSFENKLTWTYPDKSSSGADCDKDIVKYTIYYAPAVGTDFTKIGEITSPRPPATTFTHTKTDSYIGCYYVTATNRFGTESARSNVVCKDNCTSFDLPNIFTPNGDGKNDIFQPMKCPRFVQNVTIIVYNRNGQKVYEYSGPKLEWSGNNSSGNPLPAGSYFYTCEVKFLTLDPASPTLNLKGWVELVR